MNLDDAIQEVLRSQERIESEFVEFHKLAERVSKLELWQARLKGGWAVVIAAYVYLCKPGH